jgi:hypothetical protein
MSLLSAWSISLDSTFNTIGHFTNARSTRGGFYKWKTMDDNQTKFMPQLAIDTKFFHSTFVNPCTM